MKTFYFDTGVTIGKLFGNQQWSSNGVKIIPFDVSNNIPDNAHLMFLCDNPELPESKLQNVIVTPVFNTDMISKYAYFKVI